MSFHIVEWLNHAPLRPHELLGDLAAMNELFIIDGDSLIQDTLLHNLVDWNGSSGEYLQVAFLIERFLSDLLERGAKFQIVFFDLLALAYSNPLPTSNGQSISPQAARLLRQAVLSHLKKIKEFEVETYSDWYSDQKFNNFIEAQRPSFLLFSPCAIAPNHPLYSKLVKSSNTNASANGSVGSEIAKNIDAGTLQISSPLLMALMSISIFSRGISLAILPEIDYRDRAIWAQSLEPWNLAVYLELSESAHASIFPVLSRAATKHPKNEEINDLISSFTSKSGSINPVGGWKYIVTSVALNMLLKKTPASISDASDFHAFLKIFAIHVVLSCGLAPKNRPQQGIEGFKNQDAKFNQYLDEVTSCLAEIAPIASESDKFDSFEWNLVDIIDARLLLSVLHHMKSSQISDNERLGFSESMLADVQSIWSFATSSSPFFPVSPCNLTVAVGSNAKSLKKIDLLPVRSPLIDRILPEETRPVLYQSDVEKYNQSHQSIRRFIDDYHWHSGRELDFSEMQYFDKEFEERRTVKTRSNYQSAWARLALSLESRPNQSAVLQPKVLMKDEGSREESQVKLQQKLNLEMTPKTPEAAKMEEEVGRVKTLISSWRGSSFTKRISVLAQLSPVSATGQFEWLYALLDLHIEQKRELQAFVNSKLDVEASHIDYTKKQLDDLEREEILNQCLTMIVNCAMGILEYKGTTLLNSRLEVQKRVSDILTSLGLHSLVEPPKKELDLASSTVSGFPENEDSLQSACRFQMNRMGPWMKRDVGAVKDPRADRLLDSWQIDVLDCVDSNKSCLIVAPTSAGKSFMAFHAMTRTLETEDGILIYVAPTKALVNQVVAEVYSKYSAVNCAAGTMICGAFTREMRVAPVNCRILVTVPQCLEILLLARELASASAWRSKLKWVIFDEVHCINLDEGAVWERVLPLIPCPFMALSATIGEVQRFQEWLAGVAAAKQEYAQFVPSVEVVTKEIEAPKEDKKGGHKNAKKAGKKSKVAPVVEEKQEKVVSAPTSSAPAAPAEPFKFICHPHRYSDLYKYIMIPRFFLNNTKADSITDLEAQFKASKEDTLSASKELMNSSQGNSASASSSVQILTELRAMHPWMGLKPARFRSEFPPTSSFSPKECLQVYEAMAKYAHLSSTDSKSNYNIQSTLSAEAISELLALKPEVFFGEGNIIDQREMRKYEQAIKSLFKKWCSDYVDLADLVLKDLTGDTIEEIGKVTEQGLTLKMDLGSQNFLLRSLPSMVEGLRLKQWLPSIVFNFDQHFCEVLAIELHKQLLEKEKAWKTSKEYRNARIKYAEALKEHEAAQKRKEKAKSKAKRNDEDADKEEDRSVDLPVDPDFEMADGTTFTRDGEVETVDDLKREADMLRQRGIDGRLVDALRRGIGVHHAGLDKKYRMVVEKHFRTGQLKIVFATGTLALGINMPCRTTVFAGDSPHLSPLQYRQMSGRAGRRGYDPLGRVVFWGIPIHRIAYLEGAKLAPIRGTFPMSMSFNLRGLILGTADVNGVSKKTASTVSSKPVKKSGKPSAAPKGGWQAAKTKPERVVAKKPAVAKSWDDSDSEEETVATTPAAAAKPMKSWDDSDSEGEESTPQRVGDKIVQDQSTIPIPPGLDVLYTSLRHVYNHTLYLHQYPTKKSQLDIHTQCSLQYLARLGLIDLFGNPINLAGIASHLNWAEPSNIVLCKFLSSPILLEICQGWKTDWPTTGRNLLILLAHLFARKPVSPAQYILFKSQLEDRANKVKHSALKNCTHSLILPPLPKAQQDLIREHNEDCLAILNNVLIPYAKSHFPYKSDEKWLSLSSLKLSSVDQDLTAPANSIAKLVEQSALHVDARSPLAALSGNGDEFESQADLRTLRNGIFAADFGTMVSEDIHGEPQQLNAYLLDLYDYGNYDWLIQFNRFKDSALFYDCNEFLLSIKSMCAALMHRSTEPRTDPLFRSFRKLVKEFETKFQTVFKFQRREFSWITVRGVEGYKADLQKHILDTVRISVSHVKRVPTTKQGQYIFRIACRTENDKARVVEMFDKWRPLPHWWIDEEDSDDEDEDIEMI